MSVAKMSSYTIAIGLSNGCGYTIPMRPFRLVATYHSFAEFGHIYPALQCKLFDQYCCRLYGSRLWRLSGDEGRKICVVWRKAMRRLGRIYNMTHSVILALLANPYKNRSMVYH